MLVNTSFIEIVVGLRVCVILVEDLES